MRHYYPAIFLKADSKREFVQKALAKGEALQAKPWNGSRYVTLGMVTLVAYGRTAQSLKGWCQGDEIWVQVHFSVIRRQN